MKRRSRTRDDKVPCPCGSGDRYAQCCGVYHKGDKLPPTPEALMRSRFAAYAKGRASYIIETTDPEGERFETDTRGWRTSILQFTRGTRFLGLEILDTGIEPEGDRGWVRFRAQLLQSGKDASFVEHSLFRKVQGRWFYTSAAADPS